MRIIDILNESLVDPYREADPGAKNVVVVHIEKTYSVAVDLDMVKEEFGSISKANIEQFADNILSTHPRMSAHTNTYQTEMPPAPPPVKVKPKPKRYVY